MAFRIGIGAATLFAILLCARLGPSCTTTSECETGCYSIWTGWNWQGGYIGAEPYTCREGDSYWADVDEGGHCVPVDENGPDPQVAYYNCDSCWPWCNNAPAGETGLHVCMTGTQACADYIDSQPRYECTGGSE